MRVLASLNNSHGVIEIQEDLRSCHDKLRAEPSGRSMVRGEPTLCEGVSIPSRIKHDVSNSTIWNPACNQIRSKRTYWEKGAHRL